MLQTRIRVQLPTSTYKPKRSAFSWLTALLGLDAAERLRAGAERLDDRVFAVFEGVIDGFRNAGFQDVINVFVDDKAIYVDKEEDRRDLEKALAATLSSGALEGEPNEVLMVFSSVVDDMHLLAEVGIREFLVDVDAPVIIRVAARPCDLRVAPQEKATEYGARVAAMLADPEVPARWCAKVEDRVGALEATLAAELPSIGIEHDPVEIELIRPGPVQVARFRHLGFGGFVRSTSYRAKPSRRREGAFDRPFYHYYFDPYFGLATWLLLQGMVRQGAWPSERIVVVDTAGERLFDGASAQGQGELGFEVAADAVSLSETEIEVAKSVPEVNTLDISEAGSPHTPGYGGEM